MRTLLPSSVFPTSTQVLLVKALLASDDQFVLLWNEWKSIAGPYGDLDHSSLRLFPLAYRKLVRLLPADSLLTVSGNSYRTSWLKNSLLFHEAEKVISVLENLQIPLLLLKGSAFIPLYYDNDIGVRSVDDVDMIVPVAYFAQTMRAIHDSFPEYRIDTDIELFSSSLFHEISVYTPAGILDMHCHLLHGYLHDDDWEMMITKSRSVMFQEHEVATLSDSNHLVHVCAHALTRKGIEGAQLRWIIDVVRIIERQQIDWQSVVRVAKRMRTSFSVGIALRYLHEESFVQIPDWVITKLEKTPTALPDRRMAYLETQDTITAIVPAVELYWWRYVKSLSHPYTAYNSAQCAVAFAKFLCQTPSVYKIPGIITIKFFQLFGRSFARILVINFMF